MLKIVKKTIQMRFLRTITDSNIVSAVLSLDVSGSVEKVVNSYVLTGITENVVFLCELLNKL